MSATEEIRLSDSPFIANLGPGERSLWRFVGAVAAGVFAFFVASIVVTLAVLVLLILFAGWPAPTGVAGAGDLMQRMVALTQSDGRKFADAMQILALAIPSNVAPMFAFIGAAVLVHRQRLKAYITAAPRFRWRLFAIGLGLSALFVGGFVGIAQMLDPKAPAAPLLTIAADNGLRTLYATVCVLAFLPAALGEEVLFRGWLLRETSALTRNPVALMVVNGALFAAAHLQFSPDAFLTRWIMGAGFVYMTLRVGGVELSTGAHAANNIIIVLFLEPLSLRPPPTTGVTPDSLLQDGFLFAVYVVMAELTARWAPLRRWSGADLGAPARSPASAEAGPWS